MAVLAQDVVVLKPVPKVVLLNGSFNHLLAWLLFPRIEPAFLSLYVYHAGTAFTGGFSHRSPCR